MKKHLFYLPLTALLATTSHAISFSTNFEGSEGYVSGKISSDNQTGAPYFNETINGALYLPGNTSPNFGTLRRNPNSGGAAAIYNQGAGSAFSAGNTWSVGMDFTFEGLPNTNPASNTQLGGVGFSTSSTATSNTLFAGIQKSTTQTNAYQFYVFTNGGGFYTDSFGYSEIGDDPSDDNDLSDMLSIEFSLTKSATENEYDFIAILTNKDTDTTISTITNTLTNEEVEGSDLFGYINSGSVTENNNFDLFNVDSFNYSAVPEVASYSMLMGFMAFGGMLARRKRA